MDITAKRKAATEYLLSVLSEFDTLSETKNSPRYAKLFKEMSDYQFDKYMKAIRDGEACIYIYLPNMTKRPNLGEIIDLAKKHGVKIFHRIKLFDETTQEYYLTTQEYPVLKIPTRRLQQFQDKKMSVPAGDTKIDAMTGQVAGDHDSASITSPEIPSLDAKGLHNVLHEFIAIRGGNVDAWNGEMKQMLEETGECSLANISGSSRTRTATVTSILFDSMMIDNNLVE